MRYVLLGVATFALSVGVMQFVPTAGVVPPPAVVPTPVAVEEQPPAVPFRPLLAALWVHSQAALDQASNDLGDLMGEEESLATIVVRSISGVDRLPGADSRKPFGAYLHSSADNDCKLDKVAFYPVRQEGAVILALRGNNHRVELLAGDIYQVQPPQGAAWYLKVAHHYAFCSSTAAVLAKELPAPASFLPAMTPTRLAGVALRLDQVPPTLRDKMLAVIDEELAASTPAVIGRLTWSQLLANKSRGLLAMLLRDGEELGARIELDRQTDNLAAEFYLRGRPGSELAAQIGGYGQRHSRFINLQRDSCLTMCGIFPIPKDIREWLTQATAPWFAAPDLHASAAAQLWRKLVQFDTQDFALFAHGPAADGTITMLACFDFKDDQTARLFVTDDWFATSAIKRNAAAIGTTAVHQIRPVKGREDFVTRAFGDDTTYFLLKDGMFLLATGRNALPTLEQALTVIGQPVAKDAAQATLEARFSQAVRVFGDPPNFLVGSEEFRGKSRGRDRLRSTWRGGDALRLRWEVDVPLLRAAARSREAN